MKKNHAEKTKDVVERAANEAVEVKTEEKKEVLSIYDLLVDEIMASDLSADEKSVRLSKLATAQKQKVNIMLIGSTGAGKSSTINALFDMNKAKVGVGVDPETNSIEKYDLGQLTIWDTPGFGDGNADEGYKEMLVKKLSEIDDEGNYVIDLVLVVLDASSKDMGTAFHIINNVLIPCLKQENSERILIGINQSDIAMKGKHWDEEENKPDEVLLDYLHKKVTSVSERVYENTGVSVKPVFYCAGYTDDDGCQCKPYNLTKLFYYMLLSVPEEKRLVITENINLNEDSWLHDEDDENYEELTKMSVLDYILGDAVFFAEYGKMQGQRILGIPGMIIGMAIGAVAGTITGTVTKVREIVA